MQHGLFVKKKLEHVCPDVNLDQRIDIPSFQHGGIRKTNKLF